MRTSCYIGSDPGGLWPGETLVRGLNGEPGVTLLRFVGIDIDIAGDELRQEDDNADPVSVSVQARSTCVVKHDSQIDLELCVND